jgi:hypothetical protein
MRKSFSERIIAGMEEVLADIKKTKEAMQESGDDKFVDEKRLQKKVIPNGTRNDKEPADVPLEIDELSYSKKGKQKFQQVPPNQPTTNDSNTAEVKMPDKKEKKYDINRVEEIHSAWKTVKKAKEEDKYDINRIEQIKTTRADEGTGADPAEMVEHTIKMSLKNINAIVQLGAELAANINNDNAICLAKPWLAAKLTLAADYISAVHDHMMYYVEYPGDNEPEGDNPEEMSKAPVADAYYGNFDGHDGHSYSATRFGGKKRSDLKDSDFLFPEDRSFPIVVPKDVKDAIRNFGRTNKNISYDAFIKKLYNKAKNKGPEFVAAIPKATKDKLGIKKDKADYEGGNF